MLCGDDIEKDAWRLGISALRKPEGIGQMSSTIMRLLEEIEE